MTSSFGGYKLKHLVIMHPFHCLLLLWGSDGHFYTIHDMFQLCWYFQLIYSKWPPDPSHKMTATDETKVFCHWRVYLLNPWSSNSKYIYLMIRGCIDTLFNGNRLLNAQLRNWCWPLMSLTLGHHWMIFDLVSQGHLGWKTFGPYNYIVHSVEMSPWKFERKYIYFSMSYVNITLHLV